MKTKMLLVLGVLALGGLNLYFNSLSSVSLEDTILSNVEAMAQNEGTTHPNMVLKQVVPSFCKVCVDGSGNCAVSDQCCISWGNCPW